MTDKRERRAPTEPTDPDELAARRQWRERKEDFINRVALVVLCVLYLVGFAVVLQLVHRIEDTARDAAVNAAQVRRLTHRNADTLRRVEAARKQGRLLLCSSQNDQNRVLRGLIIGGTVSSKPFERQLRSLGFPPYKQRIAQARRQAGQLAPLNCITLKAIR